MLDVRRTSADDHSLDQLPGVEARLDDVGAAEQRVSLVFLRAVGAVSLRALQPWLRLRLRPRVRQVGLSDRHTLPWVSTGGEG